MAATRPNYRIIPDDLVVDFWTSGDGWPLRCYRWDPTDTPRGTILFQTGRGDFFEKYLATLAHWRAAGWRVQGFDWRGAGGSRHGPEGLPPLSTGFTALLSDLAQYLDDRMSDAPRPHFMVGHSMGGNFLLRHLAEGGDQPAGLVLLAPMLGLRSAPLKPWLARLIVNTACRMGLAERSAWTGREGGDYGSRRQQRLTQDREFYEDELWWKASNPELSSEELSWGWLAEAYRAIEALEHSSGVEKIACPTLFLAAPGDALIPIEPIQAMAARMPHAELKVSDGAHELLRESPAVRDALLAEIDRFFGRASAK